MQIVENFLGKSFSTPKKRNMLHVTYYLMFNEISSCKLKFQVSIKMSRDICIHVCTYLYLRRNVCHLLQERTRITNSRNITPI